MSVLKKQVTYFELVTFRKTYCLLDFIVYLLLA